MMYRYGEAAFASHLLYPQFMDDRDFDERKLGIYANITWSRATRNSVFYVDLGTSPGMQEALKELKNSNISVVYRNLFEPWMNLVNEMP